MMFYLIFILLPAFCATYFLGYQCTEEPDEKELEMGFKAYCNDSGVSLPRMIYNRNMCSHLGNARQFRHTNGPEHGYIYDFRYKLESNPDRDLSGNACEKAQKFATEVTRHMNETRKRKGLSASDWTASDTCKMFVANPVFYCQNHTIDRIIRSDKYLACGFFRIGHTDVIFTRERCDRMTYGLREQPGDPQKYRQCGPNNRVWVVPCVPRALFDPVNKVCKEQSHIPLLSIRRKSGKPVEAREREGTKLQPLTEEFLFSTKKPKNTRPRIKPTSTAPSSTSSFSTNLPSSTKTIGRFPTPPPFDFLSTTTRPFIPAMENTQEISRPPTVTPSMTEVESLQSLESRSTPPRSNPASHIAHTVSYKGITMSEEEFLKQLVRIVEAHQLAIGKIKEQVEQERLREKTDASKSITENYRGKGAAGNYEGKAVQTHAKELEKQKSMEKQLQREREELEWQEELARQKSAEEELKSQQEYAQKLAKTQHMKKMLAWQRELALKKAELEKKEKELAERQKQIEEKLRQEEDARKKEEEKQRQLQIEERRKQEQEMKKQELARQKAEMEMKKKEKQEKTRILAERKKEEEEKKEQERRKAEEERKNRERQQELVRLKAERLQREREEKEQKERKKLEEEHLERLQREREEKEQKERKKLEEERLIEVERIRLEFEKGMEEEARRRAELAASEQTNGSAPEKSSFRVHNSDEHATGGIDEYSGHKNNVTEAVMSGLMASKSGQTTTESEVEIMRFTAPPPTPSSPGNEWVTSPHSWRPAPDVQTNQLEWSQAQIPSTGTSELPSKIMSKCSPTSECNFDYDEDLLCPHPKELQQNVDTTQTPYDYLTTDDVLPMEVVTRKPIYRIIEEFPQDLLPSSDIQKPFIPEVEMNEMIPMNGPMPPLFPIIEPHFLVPFEKFRDEFKEDTSFLGSIVKPAVKKIALDQAETFLDRILSDDAESRGESSTHSVSTLSSEDGWR